MSNSVNFKFGSTIEGKTVESNDLVAVNKGMSTNATEDKKYGSIYKGDKILGSTKADDLYITEDITIAGGPLASYFDDVYNDGKIPAGTSLQAFFAALACVEKWPDPVAKASYGTLTSTLSAPTSTQSWSGSSKLVEVGTPITIGAVSAKNASSNSPSLTFDNFSYGYSTETGKFTASKTENNPPSVSATVSTATDDVWYTLSRSYSGFGRKEGHSGDSTGGSAASGLSFVAEDVTANAGKNTVKFTLSVNRQIHSATVAAPSVYYALSNLGNTNDKDGSTVQPIDKTATYTYNPSPEVPAAASSPTYEVTGVWPVYSNISGGAFTADASTRFALQTGKSFVIENTPTEVGSANNFMFDYPATHSVVSFEMKDPSGNWVPFSASYTADSGEVDKTIQDVSRKYKRFTTAGGNGPQTYRITLDKSLDQ